MRVEKTGSLLGHSARELTSLLCQLAGQNQSADHRWPPRLRTPGKDSPEPAATILLQLCPGRGGSNLEWTASVYTQHGQGRGGGTLGVRPRRELASPAHLHGAHRLSGLLGLGISHNPLGLPDSGPPCECPEWGPWASTPCPQLTQWLQGNEVAGSQP